MYKGRNPPPPEDYEDFDFMSNANKITLLLKPTISTLQYKELPSLEYFREALLRSLFVNKKSSKEDSEVFPEPPEVIKNVIEENAFVDSEGSTIDPFKEERVKKIVTIPSSRPEIQTVSDEKSKMKNAKSNMSLTYISPKAEFTKALSKDINLKNKLNVKKQITEPELPERFSRKDYEKEYPSNKLKNKIQDRKEDLGEKRKKRNMDVLGEYEHRRYKNKSNRSLQNDHSSDESEYSLKSYRSHKRCKDDRVSRKRSDRKCFRQQSESDCSDKSIEVISSKHTDTFSIFESDNKLLGKKLTRIEEKETPKMKTDSSEQLRQCQKSMQPDPDAEDAYSDDAELSACVFGGSETFYCKVCQLNLNGEACYNTHMNGKKHKKAVNAQLLRPEALLYQVIGSHIKDPSFMQALNRNVKMTKSNEKSVLQALADGYKHIPLPGLNYIDEIHNKEDVYYYCELCEAPCMKATIFPHLFGHKHYLNFMKVIEPSYYERNKDLPKKELERQVKKKVREHERKFGRKQVTVMRCDVDAKGFPSNDPGFTQRILYQEKGLDINTSITVDNYGDFYCELCDAHMNNESMFRAHMVGKRHAKNEKKSSDGLGTSLSSSGKERATNVPSVLEDMLRLVNDIPVVGLNFIRETQNTKGELYTCYLCGSGLTRCDVIEHIVSMKHRIKYLETVNENRTIPNGIGEIRELEVGTQMREDLVAGVCRTIEAKFGRGRVEVYI